MQTDLLNSADDNEEDVSGGSTPNAPDELMSSLGSDNFQLELAIATTSDGLSDKENTVRKMKNQMKYSSSQLAAV